MMPERPLRQLLWLLVLSLLFGLVVPVASAQTQNVDAMASSMFESPVFNPATNTYDALGVITNRTKGATSATLAAPMSLVITGISNPSVTVANATGTTADGKPYVDVPLPNGTLKAGAKVNQVRVQFYNPNEVNFTFTASILAGVNTTPSDKVPPSLFIKNPLNGTAVSTQPITVTGWVNDPAARIVVNGVAANVSNSGNFVANQIPLSRDGMHILTAVATDPSGNTGQASAVVALDRMAPTIVIDSPANNFTTGDAVVAIAGMVSDAVTTNPTVTVNGVAASVSNGNFIAMGIPLNPGPNVITATAKDGVGNTSTASITINRAAQPGLRVQIMSGQAQSGLAGATLPQALVVRLVDGNDEIVPNREVTFAVSRGDGTLRTAFASSNLVRSLTVLTDANGLASAVYMLGTRTGAGSNRVAVGTPGSLTSVEFCATALPAPPNRIAIIPMSDQQAGIVGKPLVEPFAAVVSDISGNPVPGVAVQFRVIEGGGSFSGAETVTANTGPDGIARALLTLGPNPGTANNKPVA